jgi:hypothetical protein
LPPPEELLDDVWEELEELEEPQPQQPQPPPPLLLEELLEEGTEEWELAPPPV